MLVVISNRKIWGVITLLAAIVTVASQARAQQAARPASAPPAPIDYNWDVRPILSDNCFRCHGPDASSRQAGLRLDQKESAYAQAVTPGKPEESELIRRITSPDPSYRMPPSYSAPKTLPAADVKTLTEWIRQGAVYKPHWAFIPPTKTMPPTSRLAGRGTSPIDRFILARLEKEGLMPSKEADKETLINRVTLTLTGLPPTLAEVDAFLADKSPNAYEKVVDRLLASPHYGENMAAYWANISRYSESDGFLDDHHDRLFWPYRDWVISAFNKNMPFNQFSTWQIAGDLLPNATKEQRLATAFLRVGKRTTENGAIDEEYRVEYVPGESDTGLFGGNSNWRGPIWFPTNFLLIEALERYHHFYGDSFLVEFPTGSGNRINLAQAAQELAKRMVALFLPGADGARPCHGTEERYKQGQTDQDLVLFHEYFHGETGLGLGANHQTGWTAVVARLIEGYSADKREK